MQDYIQALNRLNDALDKFNETQTKICNELEEAVNILNSINHE